MKFDFDYADWDSSDYGLRAQIDQTSPFFQPLGQTYWTTVSTYVPASWEDDYDTNREILWQFHSATGGPGGISPPLVLKIAGNQEIFSMWNGTDVWLGTLPFDGDKGHWVDWVIQLKFDYTDGFYKIWKNGVKVLDYTGPTIIHSGGQTNENGPFFDLGIYKWNWGILATQVSNRTMVRR